MKAIVPKPIQFEKGNELAGGFQSQIIKEWSENKTSNKKDKKMTNSIKQQELDLIQKIKEIEKSIEVSYKGLDDDQVLQACRKIEEKEQQLEQSKKVDQQCTRFEEYEEVKKKKEPSTKFEEYDEQRKTDQTEKVSFHQNQNYDNYIKYYKSQYSTMRAKYANLEAYEINRLIGQNWREIKEQAKQQQTSWRGRGRGRGSRKQRDQEEEEEELSLQRRDNQIKKKKRK